MKKVKFLLMIFAALLVAQVSNAQVKHSTYYLMKAEWYCLGSRIVGPLEIMNVHHFDKSGNVIKFHWRVKNQWIVMDSGAEYMIIDVGTVTPSFPFWGTIPEDNVEYTAINHIKIISKGTGKVYDGRVQINFVFDKDGELIVKKNMNTTCF